MDRKWPLEGEAGGSIILRDQFFKLLTSIYFSAGRRRAWHPYVFEFLTPMLCSSCKKDNNTEAKFCRYCGNKLIVQIVSTLISDTKNTVDGKKKPFGGVILLGSSLVIISLSLIYFYFPRKPHEYSSSEIFDKYKNSIVLVGTFDKNGVEQAYGTGIIVSQDGLVLTNDHVIGGAKSAYIKTHNGGMYPSGPLYDKAGNYNPGAYRDTYYDLATFKVDAKDFIPIEITQSSLPKIGEKVICIGNPLMQTNSLSEGIVSSIRGDSIKSDIQITAPISSGSSGGAMFNASGSLIGITTSTLERGQNLNFAIPARYALDLVYKYLFLESSSIDGSDNRIKEHVASEKAMIDRIDSLRSSIKEQADTLYEDLKKKKGNRAALAVEWVNKAIAAYDLGERVNTYKTIEQKSLGYSASANTQVDKSILSKRVTSAAGDYIRTSVTHACDSLFAPHITIVQNGTKLLWQGNETHTDAIGDFDVSGKFRFTLILSNGDSHTCDGLFIDQYASGSCSLGNGSCRFTYQKQ